MYILAPKIAHDIERAVELRTCGLTWEQIGIRLKRNAETIRKWKARHRSYWEHLASIAREEHVGDAGDEALAVLRVLMRSKNEKVRMDAARLLAKVRANSNTTETAKASEWDDFVNYLEGLSDDDLRTFLGDDLARFVEGPAGSGGPVTDAAGTQGPEHLC